MIMVHPEHHLKLIDMPRGDNAVLSMLKQMMYIITVRHLTNFIELNRLYTTQLTVVILQLVT